MTTNKERDERKIHRFLREKLYLTWMIEESDMIQITKGEYSIRIRPNKRIDNEYYCTIRKRNVMRDIQAYSIADVDEVTDLLEEFINEEINYHE